jgi:hypothetical protein
MDTDGTPAPPVWKARPDSMMPTVAVRGTEIQPPFDMNVAVPVNAPNVDPLKPTIVGELAPASTL